VNDAVQYRIAEGGIGNDVMPLGDGDLACDQQRSFVIAVIPTQDGGSVLPRRARRREANLFRRRASRLPGGAPPCKRHSSLYPRGPLLDPGRTDVPCLGGHIDTAPASWALAATRKRYAHKPANASGTKIQNEARTEIQNEGRDDEAALA
jgi:hypothetical protein